MLTKNQKRAKKERIKDLEYTTPSLKLLKNHGWGFTLVENNAPLVCTDPLWGKKYDFATAVMIQKDRLL